MRPVRSSRISSRAAGVAALVGALFAVSCSQPPPPQPVVATLLEPPLELPEVTLTDKADGVFTQEQLHGQFNLLFFGFTHCPDICPLTLAVLARMRAEWNTPHIDVPQVVFVSVDPARDDPAQIDTYLGVFDPLFRGVTGPREAMDPWLRALGVAVHAQPHADGEPYTVTHNSTVYVVGPGAELIAVFSPPHDAAVIAADFLRIRDHYLRTQAARGKSPAAFDRRGARLTALLVAQIYPIFSLLAPCQPSASPVSVRRGTLATGC